MSRPEAKSGMNGLQMRKYIDNHKEYYTAINKEIDRQQYIKTAHFEDIIPRKCENIGYIYMMCIMNFTDCFICKKQLDVKNALKIVSNFLYQIKQ